ncbi:MAG: SpoIIE family protein phosphatase, partial [Acidobacteriota bacterium]
RPADESITFSRSIAEKVVGEKVSILTSNAMTDPRFRSQDSIVSYGIRSAMSAPLWNNQKVTGLIYVDSLVHENVFTEDDLSLLTSLANVAAIKLENARLLEHMIEKKRMEHELELAGEIQQNLLPRESPKLAGWDIAGSNDPCYTIGGDYFDFIERPAGRMAFALGDVSGKGAAAALMMMVLRATVHSLAQQDATVASIISRTNRVMFHNSPEQSYVTFFLGDLDPESGHLQYITAGHIPPILYHGQTGELERLECGGTVLGLFETASFEEGQAELRPGDVLIVFTDGISESWGEDEEEFGDTRLIELMRKHATCSAQELLDRVLQEVDRHAKGNHPSDDRTLIVIKRGKPL